MFIYAIILLGLVIFVHELGHFLVARFFDVKVLVFSLGFGKPLFKYKKGETEYRISVIPLGGYVKMVGEGMQEQEISDEDKPRAFSYKKWWQKVCIVVAGPFANIVFALFLYAVVSLFHLKATAPIVEFVSNDSAASAAGIEAGDEVLEINDLKIYVWDDIHSAISSSDKESCETLSVKVKKFDGAIVKYSVKPKLQTEKNIFGERSYRCMMGIASMPRGTKIALTAVSEVVKSGDRILSIDGREVNRFFQISYLLQNAQKLTLERDGKKMTFNLTNEERDNLRSHIVHAGMMISEVEKNSFSDSIGMKRGDIVYSVDQTRVSSPYEFISYLQKMKKGDNISLNYYRDGILEEKKFALDKEQVSDNYTGMESKRVKWGARFFSDYDAPEVLRERNGKTGYIFSYAISQTWEMTRLTVKGFYYLATGKLSAKSLGGPIMVFDVSKKAAERGLSVFLAVMAMISINLGLINLLPVPILDGGHMMMYTIEGVTGREINVKIKEAFMTVGFVLLMLLMAFAIFNDISRYFSLLMGN